MRRARFHLPRAAWRYDRDLLERGLRESDARHVVAQELGYRSWPVLEREAAAAESLRERGAEPDDADQLVRAASLDEIDRVRQLLDEGRRWRTASRRVSRSGSLRVYGA